MQIIVFVFFEVCQVFLCFSALVCYKSHFPLCLLALHKENRTVVCLPPPQMYCQWQRWLWQPRQWWGTVRRTSECSWIGWPWGWCEHLSLHWAQLITICPPLWTQNPVSSMQKSELVLSVFFFFLYFLKYYCFVLFCFYCNMAFSMKIFEDVHCTVPD